MSHSSPRWFKPSVDFIPIQLKSLQILGTLYFTSLNKTIQVRIDFDENMKLMQIKSRKPMRFEVTDERILLNCFYLSYLVLEVDVLIDEFLHSQQLLMDRSDFVCSLVLKYQLRLWLINYWLILVWKLTFLLLKLFIINLHFRRSRVNLINLHLSMLTWLFWIAHVQNIKYFSLVNRVSIDYVPHWSSTGSNCTFPSFRLWFVWYFSFLFLFLH